MDSIANVSIQTKCVSLRNEKYKTPPTLINLHPNEYTQRFRYYPFVANLDKCVGSCHTVDDLSNKLCVPNETEDLNLSVFNMITEINEPKTLKKHISCEC